MVQLAHLIGRHAKRDDDLGERMALLQALEHERGELALRQLGRADREERGFKGDLDIDIDNFTVELETAHHQAQHGGGNWQKGREWPGEWNQLVKKTLENREGKLRRRMTAAEIIREVELLMKDRGIPVRFVPYRGD